MIEIEIPGLPPSTNHAFRNIAHGRVLTHEAKVWKQGVALAVLSKRLRPLEGMVQVSLVFYSQKWFTKAGKPRKIDLDNLAKLFLDAVFGQLGMDDSLIFSLNLHKRVGPELSVIRISPLTP